MHCTLTSRTALKPLELISKKMKKLIIFLLLANFIACKQNTNSIYKRDIETYQAGNKKPLVRY